MKFIPIAITAAALAALSTPAAGQMGASASYEFVKAVRDRNGGKAQELLRSNPPGILNAKDDDGNTALIIAVSREDQDWTAFLIKQGADVNLPGRGGETPLIAAARSGFEDAVDWLLGDGAKIDGTNKMGETPLIVAVQLRNARLVKMLLDAGANPDKPDSAAGLSARDYAARDTRSRQILQLIEAKKPKPAR